VKTSSALLLALCADTPYIGDHALKDLLLQSVEIQAEFIGERNQVVVLEEIILLDTQPGLTDLR
jgi:hypothetical protein